MKKYFFILFCAYVGITASGQYVYHGQVFSKLRQRPIGFGRVQLKKSNCACGNGKTLAEIDSLGYFTFSLKDTANVWIAVDCELDGKATQRIIYSDSITRILVRSDCNEYNAERANRDIEQHEICLLCQFGYFRFKFTESDSAFEKKYAVTYRSFGDEPQYSDCMWLYNKTVAQYLDTKFGEGWRQEVRWDVDFK